jgi:hypothetical protein
MHRYNVEVIHEPTGEYISFEYESEETEQEVWNEILGDLSIVVHEVDQDEE